MFGLFPKVKRNAASSLTVATTPLAPESRLAKAAVLEAT